MLRFSSQSIGLLSLVLNTMCPVSSRTHSLENWKQVRLQMNLPSDANVLISSSPMASSVCPVAETDPTVDVDLAKICSGRSCSYYKDVYGKLEYRSEQCAKDMYLLIVAEPNADIPAPEAMTL